jgi:RNA polymerase sigma-70 factor, ECF subfamily
VNDLQPKCKTSETDTDLVIQSRRGNKSAFSELCRRYLQSVRGVVWGIVGNRDVTDDICQDVFLIAFRSLGLLHDYEKFASWIYSIARFQAYRFLREKKSLEIKGLLDNEPDLIGEFRTITDPADILDRNETIRHLHHMVLKMKLEYREVVELRYWRDMPIKDIAEFIGLPVPTVKWRLYKAREALRVMAAKLQIGV